MARIFVVILITALFSNSFSVYAQTSSAQEIKFKRQVIEYGAEQSVKIKLQSGETLKGRVAKISNDSFTLQIVDAAGQVTDREIAYSELSKVSKASGKKAGNTFKHGFLMGVGIYLGMAAVGLLAIGIAAAAQ